jgi:hypothetical protein
MPPKDCFGEDSLARPIVSFGIAVIAVIVLLVGACSLHNTVGKRKRRAMGAAFAGFRD